MVSAQVEEKLRQIRESDLFDSEWYAAQHSEITERGLDPARHFLRHAVARCLDPGPRFSAAFYLETHPEAKRRNANPLLHHLNHAGRGLDETSVLVAAQALLAEPGKSGMALRLAWQSLPARLRHTVAILLCNVATTPGGKGWFEALNAYLKAGAMAPVRAGDAARVFDRLRPSRVPMVDEGPLISVLMGAYNAQETIASSVRSVLAQSWRNLELIVVDDASQDGTPEILHQIARTDSRMVVLENAVNVGPYASKNRALLKARGRYITGQDADEWSHPQRLQRHIADMALLPQGSPVSSVGMLRMTPQGRFHQIRRIGGECHDGVLQHCPVSTLFERDFLRDRLGFWDSARFGADTEMMARARAVLGKTPPRLPVCAVLSLDLEGSLTNNAEFGVHPDFGVTPGRRAYRDAWKSWHRGHLTPETAYCAFPPDGSRYVLPDVAHVPLESILTNLSDNRDAIS